LLFVGEPFAAVEATLEALEARLEATEASEDVTEEAEEAIEDRTPLVADPVADEAAVVDDALVVDEAAVVVLGAVADPEPELETLAHRALCSMLAVAWSAAEQEDWRHVLAASWNACEEQTHCKSATPLHPDLLAAVVVHVNTQEGIEPVDVGSAPEVPLCAWTLSSDETARSVRKVFENIVQAWVWKKLCVKDDGRTRADEASSVYILALK